MSGSGISTHWGTSPAQAQHKAVSVLGTLREFWKSPESARFSEPLGWASPCTLKSGEKSQYGAGKTQTSVWFVFGSFCLFIPVWRSVCQRWQGSTGLLTGHQTICPPARK